MDPQIWKDATAREQTQELLYTLCTHSTQSGLYSNSGHRNSCDNDRTVSVSLHPCADVWFELGMGKYLQQISINAVCALLGPETSRVMPLFHFYGKGKKSVWDAWKSHPHVTEAFLSLVDHAFSTWTQMTPSLSSSSVSPWLSITRPAVFPL